MASAVGYAGIAGSWGGASAPLRWQGGYQPGIVSKDTGPDSFWFTIAGQSKAPRIEYCLNLGRMVMTLHHSEDY